MAQTLTAKAFVAALKAQQSAAELKKYERFFPVAARGDDEFLGVRMGEVFALAKASSDMPLDEVERLLESNLHEARVGAVSVMDFQARARKTTEARRKELFDLYIRRHDRINTWDLVDRSAIYVVGGYLSDKPRGILRKLARSKQTPERRTAIVSTMHFAMREDVGDTFAIAKLLLKDQDDLIHKATGWALRTAGGDDLLAFLDLHATAMPRTMLRAAVEKLGPADRTRYMRPRPD
jgi:3-methyladenine DNA glycosylase AlkD